MNKSHEKNYVPIEKLHENEEEYFYKAFCAEFESFVYPVIEEFCGETIVSDSMKTLSFREVQHYFHIIARRYKIDRGDFAKVNNLEGCNNWYEMILMYREKVGVK